MNERKTIALVVANITSKNMILEQGYVIAYLKSCDETNLVTIELDKHQTIEQAIRNPAYESEKNPATNESQRRREDIINELQVHIPKLEIDFSELSDKQVQQVVDVVRKYSFLFSTTSTVQPGVANGVCHNINTGENRPINVPPYRVSPKEREQIRNLVNQMLRDGVAKRSNSPWASPVVLVSKKDGSIRFCVDYRKVNAITVRDAYPLPRIEDCLNALGGNAYFSTLDLISGYWQIRMAEEDKCKTAFITNDGLFEFEVMPFGLTNAPATFQRYMDMVLAGLKWQCLLVYLDDICIFSSTFENHLQDLQRTFDRLSDNNIRLKASKSHLFQNSNI